MINRRGQIYSVMQCSIYLRYLCLIISLTGHRGCSSSQRADEPQKCHFPLITDKKRRYTGWDPLTISAAQPPYSAHSNSTLSYKLSQAIVTPIPGISTWAGRVSAVITGSSRGVPTEQLSWGIGPKAVEHSFIEACSAQRRQNDSCWLCKSWSQQPEAGSKLMLWCSDSDAMQRAADRKPLSACTEGEEFGPCVLSTSVVLLKVSWYLMLQNAG